MSTSPPGVAPGARIGPYEVLAFLGEGGMGQVYRARDERLAREVAVKVIRPDLAQDAARLRRFEDEAKAAGALNHPNIVAVYDTGRHEGVPYIVSELLQGETLRSRLASGALGARKAADCGVQIARGLAAAHERGIVHRDLKPANLFLTRDGLVKILDFGIAKLGRPDEEPVGSEAATESHTATADGAILGTLGYMSPEQVRGLPADHRSDLFSLGAVLFEMITGRRAFKGATSADTLSAILREDPTEAIANGDASVPAGLLRVLRRCLEKLPEERFQSARDLAFALEASATEARPVPPHLVGTRSPRPALKAAIALGVLLVACAASAWLARRSAPGPTPPSFQRLTFRVGRVESARFGPDGQIVYGAKWGASPSEIFSTRAGATTSLSLGLRDAAILSISSRNEMAVMVRPRVVTWGTYMGTLARAPLVGGTPREVLEDVLSADFSPDGKDLAVVRMLDERCRLEYPIGRVLYEPEPPAWISGVSVSPDGRRVAIAEHPLARDTRGGIAVVAAGEPKRSLATGFQAVNRAIWSSDGNELWFSGSRVGQPQQILALSLSGRERVIDELAGNLSLHDVTHRGQVLLTRGTNWAEIRARSRGAPDEVELPAADLSILADLSDDGRLALGTDVGQGGGPNFAFYVQKTDGSAPIWLGEGDGQALSPDGRFVLALIGQSSRQQLVIAPTGAGETRALAAGPILHYSRAVWVPPGTRVLIAGSDAADVERVYVQDVAGGPPRPITTEGVSLANLGRPVDPDGSRLAAIDPDGVPSIYALAGGAPSPIPGLTKFDVPLAWTTDGRELLVARYQDYALLRIDRVDVQSGRTRPWHGLGRLPSALLGETRLLVTPDGESYAYGYVRSLSDLYLSSPLQ